MKALVSMAVVGSAAFVMAAGCNAQVAPEEVGTVSGALIVIDWPELPLCNILRRGEVYYVQSARKLVYCDGSKHQPLPLDSNGILTLVKVASATPAQCATGGVVIQVGPDTNKDGVIDTVTSSAAVCNGAQGPAGAQGAAGANGATGAAGANGSAGKSSVVRQTTEPAGANCASGGVRIDSGVDDNGDGILQDVEVDQTSYVCAPPAVTCGPGYHLCASAGPVTCANDSSPLSCGSSCTPCAAPANGTATCNAGACDFTCSFPYERQGNACVDTSCQTVGGCTSTQYCSSTTRRCEPKKVSGTCQSGIECASGSCLFGVCSSPTCPASGCDSASYCSTSNQCERKKGFFSPCLSNVECISGVCNGGFCN